MACDLQPDRGFFLAFGGARIESDDSPAKLVRRRWEQDYEEWEASWSELPLGLFQDLWGIVRAVGSSKLVQWKPPKASEYSLYLLSDQEYRSTSWQRYRVRFLLRLVRGVAPATGQTAPILEFAAA